MTDTEVISSNIYPSLTYDDAPAAVEWLRRAFGFTARLVVPGPEGTIVHSELSLGPGVLMVSSPKPDDRRVGPRGLPGVSQTLCVRVEDPDAHFACARAAGAKIVRELEDEDYGSRGYMAGDPTRRDTSGTSAPTCRVRTGAPARRSRTARARRGLAAALRSPGPRRRTPDAVLSTHADRVALAVMSRRRVLTRHDEGVDDVRAQTW